MNGFGFGFSAALGTLLNPFDWTGKFPSDLAITINSDDLLTLTWVNNGLSDYDDIRIERSVNGGAYAELAIVDLETETYADGDVEPQAYSYRVRYKSGGSYSAYTEIVLIVENDFYDAINAIMTEDGLALITENGLFITA